MTTEVVAVVLAVAFGVAGIAKIGGAPVMRTAARHLGFSVGQYRVFGALELAGAVGLLGLVVPAIGVAAAIGLGLLLIGAGIAHVVNRDDPSRVAVPLVLVTVVAAYGMAMAG